MPEPIEWATRDGVVASDLVREMYLAALEGAPLWQLPLQITEHSDAAQVIRGPFDAADCSAVLLHWFDGGLVECVTLAWVEIDTDTVGAKDARREPRDESAEFLEQERARELLADVSRWTSDGPDADVDLTRSDAAEGLSFADWFDRLDGLPAHLITQ